MRHTLALLGAHGTTFRNSYVSYPLCCPSRATQLTGQYAHNHGVLTDQRFTDLDSANTLAVWLKRAKYRTAMVGKYLNGYGVVDPRQVPPGWKQWFGLTGGTEQKRYGFKLNENGKVHNYPRKPANYIDYVLGAKVNGLVKAWAPSPKPFFLYYNPNNPHGEKGTPVWSTRDPEPAPRYLGHFGDIPAPQPPNFDEPNVSDKPKQIRDIPRLTDQDKADIDRRYRGRLESLLSVDDEVKSIVNLVRKYGDKRKTFFIFTSDNGLELGAHRIEFKDYLYEEGDRVPLIIRGPGVPENTTRDQLVANIDLAPTIATITKARPGRVMDGIDLLPLTRDPNVANNRSILFESVDLGHLRGPARPLVLQPLLERGRGALQPRRRPLPADQRGLGSWAREPEGVAEGRPGATAQLLRGYLQVARRARQVAEASSSFRCIASASALTPLIGRTYTAIRSTRPSESKWRKSMPSSSRSPTRALKARAAASPVST